MPPAEPQVRKPRPTARKKKTTTTVAKTPEAPIVEKLPDAKVVLVVGDFIAGSVGEGLATAFEATPGIRVERRTNGSSGIVRDDYYNWPESLPALSPHRLAPRRRSSGSSGKRVSGAGLGGEIGRSMSTYRSMS